MFRRLWVEGFYKFLCVRMLLNQGSSTNDCMIFLKKKKKSYVETVASSFKLYNFGVFPQNLEIKFHVKFRADCVKYFATESFSSYCRWKSNREDVLGVIGSKLLKKERLGVLSLPGVLQPCRLVRSCPSA